MYDKTWWLKTLLKNHKPSIPLKNAMALGGLPTEVKGLVGIQQDPEHHPEGDVWTHTCMALDTAAAKFRELAWHGNASAEVVMFGTLCHDFGKASTTQFSEGRWRALGHAQAGVDPTKTFLSRLGFDLEFIARIGAIVQEHLTPVELYKLNQNEVVSDSTIRRLTARLQPATIEELIAVSYADVWGRGQEKIGTFDEGEWLLRRVRWIQEEDHAKIPDAFTGKDLVNIGLTPCPDFGIIVKLGNQLRDSLGTDFVSAEWLLKIAKHTEGLQGQAKNTRAVESMR
ncbi:MAG TPA: HD domain-containing protein, partial [Patescibacteria group bacterium]|nr:HD domain-containing protein [Patescibacteria group bacterium]